MRHFLSLLEKWVVAPLPTPSSTPSSQTGASLLPPNPMPPSLDLTMPHIDIVAFLANRTHATTAEEALSLSLLAIGAVHLSYLHHESATTHMFDSADDPTLAQGSIDASERYREVSESLVDATLSLTRSSMLLLEARKKRRGTVLVDADGTADTALGMLGIAMDGCLLTRCLAGGGNFSEALSLAKVGPRFLCRQVLSCDNGC